MNVFISWSGDRSRQLAKAIGPLLSGTVPGLNVWMSEEAIIPGTPWLIALNQTLQRSDVGVLCLTPESLSSGWLLFEAGALAKQVAESRVVPYRLGVTSEDMTLPLAQFQGVEADREGTLKLVKSLNSSSTPPLDETSLLAGFERLWPALHTTIDRLRSAAPSTSPREIERERQKVRAFCTRVAGTWWERIPGEGIGFFQLEMDHLHNSARLADGRFYDEHANFRAYFNSAASRISQEGGRNRIVYVRECQNPSRDGANWFHGYGDVSFEGTGESLDRGHGTFYDMPSTDPKQAIARAVTLSRAPDENETIRIMARGTPAEQRALVRKMIARG